jgi:hypothetical protein
MLDNNVIERITQTSRLAAAKRPKIKLRQMNSLPVTLAEHFESDLDIDEAIVLVSTWRVWVKNLTQVSTGTPYRGRVG